MINLLIQLSETVHVSNNYKDDFIISLKYLLILNLQKKNNNICSHYYKCVFTR